MRQLIHTYDSSLLVTNKKVTLSDFGASHPVNLDRLLVIVDAVTNDVLYNFADKTVAQATISSNNVVTLSALPAGFAGANGDKLEIWYDTLIGDPNYTPDLQYLSVAGFPNMLHHASAEGKLSASAATTVSWNVSPGGAIGQVVEFSLSHDGAAELAFTLDGSTPALSESYPLTVVSVTLTNGSPTATVVSGGFANVTPGMFVSATGVVAGTYVSAYTYGSNSLTLSANYPGTTGTYTLTFTGNFMDVLPATPTSITLPVNAVPNLQLFSTGTPAWRASYRGS